MNGIVLNYFLRHALSSVPPDELLAGPLSNTFT